MANIYLALNGDDVGTRIGEAIASDDHEGLASASSAIEGAHGSIDQWVESVGGKKVTRSGDEGIYCLPEEALGDLEAVRSSYKEQSGHGLTVGVGSSMSEASKALIYGKLNGKDQVVHYEPSIEDYLSDQDADEDMPAEVPMDSGDQESSEAPAPAEGDDQEGEDDAQDSGNAQMAAKKPPVPSVEADGNPDEADGEDDQDDDEQAEDQSQAEGFAPAHPADENADEDADEDVDAEHAAPGDDEGDDNQKATESPEDTSMLMGDDSNDDGDLKDQEDPADPDAPGSRAIDGKVDGKDFGADKDNSEDDDQDAAAPDDSEDAQPETLAGDEEAQDGEAMADTPPAMPGEEPQGESTYQELNQDDLSNPDMDLGNENQDESDDQGQPQDQDDALTNMIHGDMEDQSPEDQSEGQPDDGAPGEDSSLDDELRQDIASALMAFKENKDVLEQAREQNPKLYQATITMLASMIAMAKKLGQNPAQDMQDQENEQQLNEEFPGAEDQSEDMAQPPTASGAPPAQPDTGGMSTEKKLKGKLQ